jgi:hypothetical protein
VKSPPFASAHSRSYKRSRRTKRKGTSQCGYSKGKPRISNITTNRLSQAEAAEAIELGAQLLWVAHQMFDPVVVEAVVVVFEAASAGLLTSPSSSLTRHSSLVAAVAAIEPDALA